MYVCFDNVHIIAFAVQRIERMDLIFTFLKSEYEDVEDEEISDIEDEDLEDDDLGDEEDEDEYEDDDDEESEDDERDGRRRIILWDLVPNIPERTLANMFTALAVVVLVAIVFHYNDRHQQHVLAYVNDKERLETDCERCRSTASHVARQIDEYADRLDRSAGLLTENEDVLRVLEIERRHLQLLVETAGRELGRTEDRLEALKTELDLLRLEEHGFRC